MAGKGSRKNGSTRKMGASPAAKSRAGGPARTGGTRSGGRAMSGRAASTRAAAGDARRQGARPASKSSGEEAKAKDKEKGAVQPEGQRQPAPPFPKQHQPHPGLEADMEPRPKYEAPTYRAADKLAGKRALVTGGDSGIGRAVAVLFAREGADVAIAYLPEEQVDAEETRAAVEAEGRRCMLLPGDVSDSRYCERAVRAVVRELGGLDILVNNAAFQRRAESIDELSVEQFEHTFRTNIFGYFYLAKAAVPHLRRGCSIINTGSITGLEGNKELLDYSSTKGAIHAFTKSLAQQLVERGIRVNCVAPGPVWTPLNIQDKPPAKAAKSAKHGADAPMKRPAQPEEVAPAYVFFASDADSSYITGEVLTLLGGDTTAA